MTSCERAPDLLQSAQHHDGGRTLHALSEVRHGRMAIDQFPQRVKTKIDTTVIRICTKLVGIVVVVVTV